MCFGYKRSKKLARQNGFRIIGRASLAAPAVVAQSVAAQLGAATPSDAEPPEVQTEPVRESVPAVEVAVAPVSEPAPAPVPDPILQRQVQPWRLLSARVATTIGRRPQRPAKECTDLTRSPHLTLPPSPPAESCNAATAARGCGRQETEGASSTRRLLPAGGTPSPDSARNLKDVRTHR